MESLSYADKIRNLKNNVIKMLQERSMDMQRDGSQSPASIWTEALSVFDYLVNLSDENFLNIRYHTNLITGDSILNYWHPYPPIDPEIFADNSNYNFFTEDIPAANWVSEPSAPNIPRPLGVKYRDKIINNDIARYQSCVSNLYSMGVLDQLKNIDKNLIVEVGGGYGGLAHGLGKILPGNSAYIILDFPEMLLFSGGFLIVNNPGKRIYIYEKDTFTPEFLESGIYDYDYVLLPNYVLKKLYSLQEINLMINMQSFQEMTKEQINEYAEFGHSKLSGFLYSHNIDIHPHNQSLSPDTVTSILSNYFELFPPPEFYDRHVKIYNSWFYKIYISQSEKGKRLPDGNMRFTSEGDRYLILKSERGYTFKVKRDWKTYCYNKAMELKESVFNFLSNLKG